MGEHEDIYHFGVQDVSQPQYLDLTRPRIFYISVPTLPILVVQTTLATWGAFSHAGMC